MEVGCPIKDVRVTFLIDEPEKCSALYHLKHMLYFNFNLIYFGLKCVL